ncbi:MAG: Arc family DNA-binding protein [Gammaproteobacteria bacterium]|nr:Arc family DNA-binding protein [Gammaproteobacteria bacterium]NNC97069.1 Arc family DNA-binding protein [Gammaproteobacteria bacterium]NNM14335.1 Arc family DNA-binding protein [Gammaproteobacteria bacterium]
MSKKKSFLLRLPPELMDELQRWSNDELRSLNGQIEYVLRDALRKQRGYTRASVKKDPEENNS